MAADQGHANAQFNLGFMYENGQGVGQDFGEAIKWYRMAADQGDAGAQYMLGVTYENGEGVGQDMTEAMVWYRMAADQGHEGAQARVDSSESELEGGEVHESDDDDQ